MSPLTISLRSLIRHRRAHPDLDGSLEPFFDHERLEAYRAARELNREISQLLKDIPRGHAECRDNLRRAAMSVTRNIAEGSGRWQLRDKIHFFHIARASATECAACLDELIDFELMPASRIERPKLLLSRAVALLIGLIKSLEVRSSREAR